MTMSMKKTLLSAALGLGLAVGVAAAPALAAGSAPPAPRQTWTFSGPFGQFDKAQLQRGYKVYREVCSACHALGLVAFRNLTEKGGPEFSEEQIRALIAEAGYQVTDGPNDAGEMYQRPARLSDRYPKNFPNEQAARAANGGAYPPDMSLIAKARSTSQGFPWFILDGLPGLLYAEHGPDYLYNLLTSYGKEPEHGETCGDGLYYNPAFISGHCIAMAQPISDDQVTYDDGSPQTVSQYSKDIAAFLMWAAEPKLEERKQVAFNVMIFMILFAGLLYFTTKKLWAGIKH